MECYSVCEFDAILKKFLSRVMRKQNFCLYAKTKAQISAFFFFFFVFDTRIRKTYPCNEYPLKPHFYIGKMGYAGVYLVFLFLLQNIDCGYSLEPPRRGGSNVYPQSMF